MHHARLAVNEDLDRLRLRALRLGALRLGATVVGVLALVLGEPALDQLREHGVRRALAQRRCRRGERRGAGHQTDPLLLVAAYGGGRLGDAPELELASDKRVLVATQCELLLREPLRLLGLLRLERDPLDCELMRLLGDDLRHALAHALQLRQQGFGHCR